MRGESGRAEGTDARVRLRLVGLIAMVEDEQPLDQEEAEKACTDQRSDATRVADRVHRLGQHVEQRDRDDDAAAERDQGVDLLADTEGEVAAEQRREDCQAGERDRDPGRGDHAAHRAQVP